MKKFLALPLNAGPHSMLDGYWDRCTVSVSKYFNDSKEKIYAVVVMYDTQ